MTTDTRKAFALAALIVATGIATVELTRSPAQADPMLVSGGAAGYASVRVDAAFELVAAMPEFAAVMVPMAEKGDLPVPFGCQGDTEAECMDVAYEVESVPSIVVETRIGNTSTLMRMDPMTVAGVEDEHIQQSE
jgi:hypothetical protein